MRVRWSKLTDADIDAIAGRREQLIEILLERYGLARGEATNQADTFVRSLQVLSL
jgi:hypothetical protein